MQLRYEFHLKLNVLEPWVEKGCNPKPWPKGVGHHLDMDVDEPKLNWDDMSIF